MKVIIIGAGAAGVTAAINYKRNHKNDDVLIIEHLDKPLKKILATGNGKCNLGNSKINLNNYNNPCFASEILENYDYKAFFRSIGIETKLIDNLAYPVSESAVSVRDAFLKELEKLKITINLNEKLIDYISKEKVEVITDKNTYYADKLILAGGLYSSPKLGSDGSLLEIIKKHNYKIVDPKPGLCPIYTKEKTKELDGIRCKANITLINENKVIHEERGELLFKEHGLSGIVIFNTASIISRITSNNTKIFVDLLPDFDANYIKNYCKTHTFDEFCLAFINPKITKYLLNRFSNKSLIIDAVKHLEFTFDKPYSYDNSQITVGGVDINEVDNFLLSKKEKNVIIIGEMLNIDGPCGGYNLSWAFASAIKATL